MAGKNTAVYGIYTNRGIAENAVDRLLAQGFRNEDIPVWSTPHLPRSA